MRPSLVTLAKRATPLPLESLNKGVATLNSMLPASHWALRKQDIPDGGIQSFIEADYKLRNFTITWQFLNLVAAAAHSARHHPTITTTYNKVNIQLTTHDVGNQVTLSDLRLAALIHNCYKDIIQKDPRGDHGQLSDRARSVLEETEARKIIEELTKH